MSPLKSNDIDKGDNYWNLYAIKFLCGYQQETRDSANVEVVPLTAAPTLRPGIYATDVNILNPNPVKVDIYKYYIPMIKSGTAIAREPDIQGQLSKPDTITLSPHQATFDDCTKMYNWMQLHPTSSPLSMGYFEIFSKSILIINAVYTVNDVRGLNTCLQVLNIEPMVITWKPPQGPK